MAKTSAGILLYRFTGEGLEVLLGHPGGPYYRRKDAGVWTIPKGLIEEGEDSFHAACREFKEETGIQRLPRDLESYLPIGEIRFKSGKVVHAWALEGTCEPETLESNSFELEWPPKTGKMIEAPELDRFEFFSMGAASDKVHPAQLRFLQRLHKELMRRRVRGELDSSPTAGSRL